MTPKATVIQLGEDGPKIDQTLVEMRDMLIYTVAALMRSHMIRKIDIGMHNHTPWESLRPSLWSFEGINRPKAIEAIVAEVVRSCCSLMRLYGVTTIELDMSQEEISGLHDVVNRTGMIRATPPEPPVLNDEPNSEKN